METSAAFKDYLLRLGHTQMKLTPGQGLEAMFSFYRSIRVERCTGFPDGDMLLLQWGTYDWGSGAYFDLDITRQLITDGQAEDENIWQLSLTFRFSPTQQNTGFGYGNRWCDSISQLEQFVGYVRNLAVVEQLKNSLPYRVELDFFNAG